MTHPHAPDCPWYLKRDVYLPLLTRLQVSEEEYLESAHRVSKQFPLTWVQEELRIRAKQDTVFERLLPPLHAWLTHNPMPDLLGIACGGYMYLAEIHRLGRLLDSWMSQVSTPRQLVRLRGPPDQYIGALFELEVLDEFVRAGFSLPGEPDNDGSDFIFQRGDSTISVEATHRGASAVMALELKVMRLVLSSPHHHSVPRIVEVCIRRSFANQAALADEIASYVLKAEAGELNSGYHHPEGAFRITVRVAERGQTSFQWGRPGIAEIQELVRSQLTKKRRQLRMHPLSYCALDLRTLVPWVIGGGQLADNADLHRCLAEIELVTRAFLQTEPSVAGVLFWIGRSIYPGNRLDRLLNPNAVALLFDPGRCRQLDMKALFPFATPLSEICL